MIELLVMLAALVAGIVGLGVALVVAAFAVVLKLCWWLFKLMVVGAALYGVVMLGVGIPLVVVLAAALVGYWLGRRSRKATAS